MRDRDHRPGTPDDEVGRGGDAADPADVGDVLAVSGDDERRAGGERGGEAGRNEEVRVDDVGPEAAGGGARVAGEPEVPCHAAAAAVDDGPLELVPSLRERLLELGDEDAEIGVFGSRVHLRDEQDAHCA